MNVNKLILLFLLIPFSCFSQKKDVYYILDTTHSEYIINNNLIKIQKGSVIRISNRKEYEKHQKKVKEAKENGTYSYDKECGCDNLNMYISSLEFEIFSRKKKILTACDLQKLNLVDYKWIKENSWKPINSKYYKVDFKNLFFIYKVKNGEYLFYKVGITLSVN